MWGGVAHFRLRKFGEDALRTSQGCKTRLLHIQHKMPYMPGPDASPNALLFQAWLDGLENWDLQRILDPCDETLVHQILPASLGRPRMSKKGYEGYIQSVVPIFATFVVGFRL